MHMVLLGESQLHVFYVEHAEREREGARQRLATEVRKAERKEAKQAPSRGFIPRIAGALGLF